MEAGVGVPSTIRGECRVSDRVMTDEEKTEALAEKDRILAQRAANLPYEPMKYGSGVDRRMVSTQTRNVAPQDAGGQQMQQGQSSPVDGIINDEMVHPDDDVHLNVKRLHVGEISLLVEDVNAHVSLHTQVLRLLKLDVGADIHLGKVEFKILDVDAQAILKVRLSRVAQILDRVLLTIDRNPAILENLTRGLGNALTDIGRGVGYGAGNALTDIGRGVGYGAGNALTDIGKGAGSALTDVGRGAGNALTDIGRGVGYGAGNALT